MTRISVRGVAVVSATAVTAVGAVVGAAAGSEGGAPVRTVDVASATLFDEAPAGAQAQQVSDGIGHQADAQQVSADAAAKKAAEEAARLKAAAEAQAKADADKAAKAEADKAAADKAEADKAAKDKDKAAKEQASQAAAHSVLAAIPAGSVQETARQIIGDDAQFQCFSQIVQRESGWNYTASNPSGAYGLVQALPGSKMATAGADWRTNPATQIKWGLNYMNSRYGSPCGAWSFWQTHHWY